MDDRFILMCFMCLRSGVFYVRLSIWGVSFFSCLFTPFFNSKFGEFLRGYGGQGRRPCNFHAIRLIATLLCFSCRLVIFFHVDTWHLAVFL